MATASHQPNDIYSYCDVCHVNHMQKRKHIFSKKHKEKLKTTLKKFANKIKEIRLFLQNPTIEGGQCGQGKCTFWCHFCKNKVSKHVTDNFKTILYGGVLEHLSSDEHSDAIERYWHINGIEKKTKFAFIISKVDLDLYKKKLVTIVDQYDEKEIKQTKKLALQIKLQEDSRKVAAYKDFDNLTVNPVVYRTVKNQHNILQNPTGFHDGIRVWKGGIVKYKDNSNQVIQCKYNAKTSKKISCNSKSIVHTVDAQGEGLTSIRVKSNIQQGNIHTGGRPPWLCDEKLEPVMNNIIGPSQLNYNEHIEQVKRSKLNPNRVGANFDHCINNTGDSNWLPSFGRVWNEGARWKSRRQYYNESTAKKKKHN